MNALTHTVDPAAVTVTYETSGGSQLAAALARAQGELTNPRKDKTAKVKSDKGNYEYQYVTLADGLEAVRSVLSKNGIAVIQPTRISGDWLMLDTHLIHASGERLSSEWPVCRGQITPQQMGSALSYARRYSLFALVGIAGDDDDDGNAASANVRAAAAPPPPPPPPKIEPDDTAWTKFRLALSAAPDKATIDKRLAQFTAKYALTTLEEMDARALAADAFSELTPP